MSGLPVVCIHGALRSRAGMWPTAAYLRRLGFDARTFGYATRRDALHQHAQRLDDFIAKAWPQPATQVGFVTHSMGGVVVRAWLAEHRPAADVRVVMLSPPNQGSALARANESNPLFHWLYGQAAQTLGEEGLPQLPAVPDNAQILVLAGGRGDPRGYNPKIEGDDDGVVACAEMGLPGIEPEFVGGVHGLLQWTPAILRRAASFLEGDRV